MYYKPLNQNKMKTILKLSASLLLLLSTSFIFIAVVTIIENLF